MKDKVTSKNYKFDRDNLDRVTAIYEVDQDGLSISNGYFESYDYGAYGELKKKTIEGKEYEFNYSGKNHNKLIGMVTPIANEEYEYDCLNRSKKITQILGLNKYGKRFNYRKVGDHATNQIQSISYLKNGMTDGKVSYTYDNMGNISSVNENGRQTLKYTYDALDRLIKENLLDKDKEICYTYDNNGNILTKSVNGAVVEYRYKEDSDQLVAFGDETFAYDVIGNPTTFRGMTAEWQNGRQLKSLDDGANKVEYTYDGRGLRRTKKVGGVTTTYTYDSNGKLIREVGGKTIEYVYGADGIIGIIIDQVPYVFRKNVFGDVTHIYNENGELVGKYSYTAFGECTVDLDIDGVASNNPIRYRSYYYDDETSLYFLKTRYYDPELGRVMTIDGIEYLNPETINGLNLYAYCGNNPIANIDPFGCIPVASIFTRLYYKELVWGVNNKWWGRIDYSITILSKQTDKTGFFYAFSDLNINDGEKSGGIGINVFGWLGFELAGSTSGNLLVGTNITPWLNLGMGIGLNGLSFSVGIKAGETNQELSIGIGLAPLVIIAGIALIVFSGGQTSSIVMGWFRNIFGF